MKQRKKVLLPLSCCQWQTHQSVNTNKMRWITCLYALNYYRKNETNNLYYKNLEKLNRINPSFILNFLIKVLKIVKPQAQLITWCSGEYQRDMNQQQNSELWSAVWCCLINFPNPGIPAVKKKKIDEGNSYTDIFSPSRASFRTF